MKINSGLSLLSSYITKSWVRFPHGKNVFVIFVPDLYVDVDVIFINARE